MNKWYGLAKGTRFPWYCFYIMLGTTAVHVMLWTVNRKPKLIWYNEEQFDYCMNYTKFQLAWFIGLKTS